jgi:TRAP-type mannitol/chloroaromatic compound transport system permease small subunit
MIEVSTWIKANWLLLTILVLIAGAFTLLRSKPSNVASLDELNAVLSADQPTVVEFYSNF